MRPAIIAAAVKIPVEAINVSTVSRRLTVEHLPMGADELETVEAFYRDGDYLCVPRQFGIDLCNQLQIDTEDQTSMGAAVKFPRVPTPRDYQVEYIDAIVDQFNEFFDIIFKARTAFGKTITSLIIASILGRSTLIVVDQENLRDQWIKVLTDPALFGFKPEQVGLIQGKVCRYKGCAVTVAMVQTLSQRVLPEDMKEAFGFLILDEVHSIGAPTFSRVLLDFTATYRLGVSATPKRKDAMQKLLDYSLGPIRIEAEQQHERSAVYFVRHHTTYSWYANTSPKIGRILTEIAEDPARNLRMAELILYLYDTGRDILVMSDRVEQLAALRDMLYYMGLEDEDVGLYTADEPVYKFGKDPKPLRRPPDWVRGTEYTPTSIQIARKKIPAKTLEIRKETARVVLSTYGKFKKGVDEPRLSGGLDITPKSEASQVHGRIKRGESELEPIWITIADWNNYRLVRWFAERIKDYHKDNADFYELNEDGSITEWHKDDLIALAHARERELKNMRIEPNNCGGNTLMTQTSARRQKEMRSPLIARITRSHRAG